MFKNGGRQNRFLIYSGLHKAVRRSRPDIAAQYANLLSRITKPIQVKRYLANLIWEESRSLNAMILARDSATSVVELVSHVSRARKKWELRALGDHFGLWYAGFVECFAEAAISEVTFMRRLRSLSEPVSAYALFFWLRRKPELQSLFWDYVLDRAAHDAESPLKSLMQSSPHKANRSYGRMITLERLIGLVPEGCEELHENFPPREATLPLIGDEIFDCHLWEGQRRFLRHWRELKLGRLPEGCSLDLRYSGQLPGCAWRQSCYEEHGQMRRSDGSEFTWNQVAIPSERLEQALKFDEYWYPRLWARAHSGRT